MDHVASVPSAASGRMSPEAMGLAMLLHAVAALAFWWLAVNRPMIAPQQEPIEIVIEQPKSEPPPTPPPPQVQPQQVPPPVEGLRPPAEITADKPTQVRPSGEAPKDIASEPQRSIEDAVPKPPQPPPAAPTEQAMAAPAPPAPTPPPDRPFVQPFPKPAPGPTIESLPPSRPSPPPPPQPPAQAHPQPPPTPPPPALTPRTQPQPSPLVAPRSQQAPAVARHQDVPTLPSSPFVNPADEHNRATAEQNYLWEVVRKLRGYRYHANVQIVEGMTVVQVVIARDGRLLSAQVVRSSGMAAMDEGVLAGVRQGSPYTPLPPEIHGPSASFRLPLVSVPLDR